MQLMMRSIAQGVVSERDRLLNYTVGEYFNELSLFIQEQEARTKELEKLNHK